MSVGGAGVSVGGAGVSVGGAGEEHWAEQERQSGQGKNRFYAVPDSATSRSDVDCFTTVFTLRYLLPSLVVNSTCT